MALKGSCAALLLPLALLGAWLALASGQPNPSPSNDLFLRRRWDNPKTPAPSGTKYCSLLTRCRGISKQNNTFIHAPIASINGVCAKKPNGKVTSQGPFKLTSCKFQGSTYIGTSLSKKIRVTCKSGVPVTFVKVVN
ncbi:ribonuclease-like [Pelodiscus sinensis]|uniref:ribonuclease-like n=1 Tax=Pelodiscus sinensis TaxID=13735 RepID=UPI003F6A8849